jgi:hypothetical protein
MRAAITNSDRPCDEGKLYITSDGFAFFNEADASKHSAKLLNKEIEKVTREAADRAMAELQDCNWEYEMEQLIDELSVE